MLKNSHLLDANAVLRFLLQDICLLYGYKAERVDDAIRQIMRKIFDGMEGAPEEEKL